MYRSRIAGISALVLADGVALTLLRPDPARLVHNLAAPRAWLAQVGPDRALAALGAAALWLAAAWIGLGLLAAASSNLPGTLGRFSAQLGRAVLPRVLRRLVAGSAGLGVFLVPVIAAAQQAPAPTSPSISISTDALPAPVWPGALPAPVWPVTPSGPPPRTPAPAPASSLPAPPPTGASIPPPRRPTRAPHPAAPVAPVPAPRHDTETAAIRVHAGDSLWLLAARRLGPHATDAQVAADWPRWYAANRDVIGDDSALITPGQVLHVPAPSTQESR